MSTPQQYYDDYWKNLQHGDGWQLHPVLRRAVEANVTKQTSVLDAACGDGRHYGAWLAGVAGAYHGIDVSPAALELARGRGLSVSQQDFEQPFARTPAADVAIAFEVIEHLFNPEPLLRSLHASLTPQGVLLATVPNFLHWRNRVSFLRGHFIPAGSPNTSFAAPWRDPHLRFFSAASFHQLLLVTGFSRVTMVGVGASPLRHCCPSLFAPTLLGIARK